MEQRNICNFGFPETSEGVMNGGEKENDMYFTFRMRQRERGLSDSKTGSSIRNMGSAAFSYSYGYALF